MRDIIVGNDRTNIVAVLKSSRLARVILLMIWWSLYELFGKRTGLHADLVFMIAVMGVVLLNIVYMPFRFLTDRNIKHGFKMVFIVAADVVAMYDLNMAGTFSMVGIIRNVIVGIIISLAVTGIIMALDRNVKVHLKEQEYRRYRENFDKMEGHDFEYFCAERLKRNGFHGVEVTQGSGDFGIDIIAYDMRGLKYGIQCKRYESCVGWHAVEEARAGAEYYGCDRAVVLTNNYFTRQAVEGAQKINVELWDREVLTRWM
jgi:restriction system protein